VLADPAPSVLLNRSAAKNALEIVVAFATAEGETAAVKSDLIEQTRKATPPRGVLALIGFQGDGLGHVTRAAMSALSSALPRRRALCTN
jgi:hypothetical protein